MRFAPILFLPAALALASCSSSVPSTADAAWIVNMIGGTSCTIPGSMIQFGDSNINADAINTRVTDQEVVMSTGQTASVACAVIPLSAGGFQIQAQTSVGADSLQVNIASINTGASMASPAMGQVTYLTDKTADHPYVGTCNFYFIPNTIESVASGKFFGAFTCAGLADNMETPASVCGVVESYLAIEDCSTSAIF